MSDSGDKIVFNDNVNCSCTNNESYLGESDLGNDQRTSSLSENLDLTNTIVAIENKSDNEDCDVNNHSIPSLTSISIDNEKEIDGIEPYDKSDSQNVIYKHNENSNTCISKCNKSNKEIDQQLNHVHDSYNEHNGSNENAMKIYTVNSKSLNISSISLNDHTGSKPIYEKSLVSRSAENISYQNQISLTDSQSSLISDSSGQNVNTEQILADFTTHKNKACSIQKIVIDNAHNNLDMQYSRLHKDILTQDLGSIVKNVHGIFSSVSGSLKNAYTNTHKLTNNKQVPGKKYIDSTTNNIPNGTILNEIFEDEFVSDENTVIEKKIERSDVEDINTEIDHDSKENSAKLHIAVLEKIINEHEKEIASLRDVVKQQADSLHEKDHIFKDFESMRKRLEHAEREKDAAVMRYATSECSIIEARRTAENAQRLEKAATAEVELLNGKLRSAQVEKQRICQLYDNKCHELMNSERELLKTREEVKELEGRVKWMQSKLRMEMEAYKESAERVEKLTKLLTESEAAKEAALTNSTEAVRARQLESELKETQASLILCRHENKDLEKRLNVSTQQLEATKMELSETNNNRQKLKSKVEELSANNIKLEEEAAELAALRARASLADTLASQLQCESERSALAQEELCKERARAETCARREAAALEHSARLTAQHVGERARLQEGEAKACALQADNVSLREQVESLQKEIQNLTTALNEETERRGRECRALARKVAELTEDLAGVNKKLEWEKGENSVLKKKHSSAIKELNRELQRSLKRCEQLEAKITAEPETPSTRTGSVSSLSSSEGTAARVAAEDNVVNGHSTENVPDIQVREPDRQMLIERIVQLQRDGARRAERCDFLEEHNRQLTVELRKKARLLRQLLCEQPAGALSSQSSDVNKKEIAKLGGGAMAAVWGGDPGGMTFELSIEMNQRLQAVLEDTLLKNITLKENMDTLGAEIARLKTQNPN